MSTAKEISYNGYEESCSRLYLVYNRIYVGKGLYTQYRIKVNAENADDALAQAYKVFDKEKGNFLTVGLGVKYG